MTKHALNRLAERCPDIDPKTAIDEIWSYIADEHATFVGQSVSGEHVWECILPTGQFIWPLMARDNAIKTILTDGMDVTMTDGKVILSPSPMPTETISGLTIGVPRKHERVTENGAYRITMARYHSQDICLGPSVSSTGIRAAALQSAHAFWTSFDGNPKRYPSKPLSESLIFGRAAHALILGDEVFDESFCFVPKDAPQRPTSTQLKAFERDGVWSELAEPRAKWWEEFDARSAGKMELKEEQVEKILFMAENLRACPDAIEVLKSDLTEISMIWKDEATGLWIKSRPDCIPTNGYDFGDLKTFSPKSRDLLLSAQRSTTDFGYPMQMALAVEGAEKALGTTAKRCALVFLQSSDPYEVIPMEISEDSLYWARCLNRQGMNIIANGFKTDNWPGVAQNIITYSYPPSMTDRFAAMQEAGEIPNI